MTAYFIDGNSLIHRAIHAGGARVLSGPDGKPTGGPFFFTKTILKLLRTVKPEVCAVALDERRDRLERRALYPPYKTNRGSPDDDIIYQIRMCVTIIQKLGLTTIRADGHEADDVVASLADIYRPGMEVVIVGTDKDLDQLVRSDCRAHHRVTRLDPYLMKTIDEEAVVDKYGLRPEQLVTYQAIMGDGIDKIPGLKGIGEKGATELVKRFGSWGRIVRAAADGLLPSGQTKTILSADEDGTYKLMKTLVKLRTDLDFDLKPKDLVFDGIDTSEARPLFRALGFRRWE